MEREKHFSLKNNLISTVSQLSDDKAGLLFKHILAYVNNQYPISEDGFVNIAFVSIKADLDKMNGISSKRSEARKNSGVARSKNEQTSTNVNKSEQTSTNVNKSEQKPIIPNKLLVKNDYPAFMEEFYRLCPTLPRAILTNARKKNIDALLKTYTLENVTEVFEKTGKSDYLTGKVVKWKANFDWLINSNKFVKVLEGNYDNGSDIKHTIDDDLIHTND
jgi:hypothetical protein